jgi:hypothetical protein
MSTWNPSTLAQFAAADEIQVAAAYAEGYGSPVTIWDVSVDGELYIRAYTGDKSRWFRAARAGGAGRLRTGDLSIDVTFDPDVDPGLIDRIDAAYHAKYDPSPSVPAMVGDAAHAHQLRVVPA